METPAENPVIIKENLVKAIDDVDIKPKRDHRGPYTTKDGLVLKYRKVSSQILFKAWSNIKYPEIPQVWIEERERYEPNPVDPMYLDARNRYINEKTHLTILIFFMRGIDVFSVPDSLIPIESDEWYKDLEEWLDIPTSKDGRKAAWLMYYAVPDDDEQNDILQDLMILSGMVMERDIQDALNNFRGDEGSEVNNGASSS